MTKKLFQSATYGAESTPYFREDFQQTLDSHLEYLKVNGNTRTVDVDPKSIGKASGDFYVILTDLNLHPKYHRTTLLLNGFTSPNQYSGENMKVFIPDTTIIDKLLTIYNTSKSKNKADVSGD